MSKIYRIHDHVESCHCWHCGGYGKVSYIRDGDVEDWMRCHDCDGDGELYRAKLTQTTVIRAFLTQAKHALEDINLTNSDLDQIYTTIDGAIGDIERYETKVGTRDGQSE
jgi:DnaJ-class molecular chaperone